MIQETLVILKPDCTRKNLEGEVIARFQQAGFHIVDMKRLSHASEELLYKHYEGIGKLETRLKESRPTEADRVFKEVIDFMQSGSVVAIIFEKEDAILDARNLAGSTRPWEAAAGTIRHDFGRHDPNLPIENVIHASANKDEAEQEIALWFSMDGIK